jgi:hypothetical protein
VLSHAPLDITSRHLMACGVFELLRTIGFAASHTDMQENGVVLLVVEAVAEEPAEEATELKGNHNSI